jgi:hypothetical protein
MPTFTIDAENDITAYAGLPAGADVSQSFSTRRNWPNSPRDCGRPAWSGPGTVLSGAALRPEAREDINQPQSRRGIWQAVQRLSPHGAQSAAIVAPAKTGAKKSPVKAPRRTRAQKGATQSRTNKKAEVVAMMKRAKAPLWPRSWKLRPGRRTRCGIRQHPGRQGRGEDRVG